MKTDRLKKRIALFVGTILILLSGVCFSDEFEYIQTPSETTVHQDLFSAVEQVPYISDEFPGVPGSKQFVSIPVVDHHLMQGFTPSILGVSVRHTPSRGNRLFLLLSTYRI